MKWVQNSELRPTFYHYWLTDAFFISFSGVREVCAGPPTREELPVHGHRAAKVLQFHDLDGIGTVYFRFDYSPLLSVRIIERVFVLFSGK